MTPCCGAARRGNRRSSRLSAHIADAEERALSRVRQMTGQDDPYVDSFDQEALADRGRYIERNLAGELGILEWLRAAHLAELAKLDGLGGSAPGGMARCRSSFMRLMSLPRRSITLPTSPAAVTAGHWGGQEPWWARRRCRKPACATRASTLDGSPWWGTQVNPESKLLLPAHCFEDCGYGRGKIQTDALKARSQAAIAKLGATWEGVIRRHTRREDGPFGDTVVYSAWKTNGPTSRQASPAGSADRGARPGQAAEPQAPVCLSRFPAEPWRWQAVRSACGRTLPARRSYRARSRLPPACHRTSRWDGYCCSGNKFAEMRIRCRPWSGQCPGRAAGNAHETRAAQRIHIPAWMAFSSRPRVSTKALILSRSAAYKT